MTCEVALGALMVASRLPLAECGCQRQSAVWRQRKLAKRRVSVPLASTDARGAEMLHRPTRHTRAPARGAAGGAAEARPRCGRRLTLLLTITQASSKVLCLATSSRLSLIDFFAACCTAASAPRPMASRSRRRCAIAVPAETRAESNVPKDDHHHIQPENVPRRPLPESAPPLAAHPSAFPARMLARAAAATSSMARAAASAAPRAVSMRHRPSARPPAEASDLIRLCAYARADEPLSVIRPVAPAPRATACFLPLLSVPAGGRKPRHRRLRGPAVPQPARGKLPELARAL